MNVAAPRRVRSTCAVFSLILGTGACTGTDATSGSNGGSSGANGIFPAAGGAGAISAISDGGASTSSRDGGGGFAASGASGSSGAAGLPASGPDGSLESGAMGSRIPAIFRICGLTSSTTVATCNGLDPYVACVRAHCDPPLSACFGSRYAEDDFTGGTCGDYASCSVASADPCHTTCAPDSACQTCIGGLVTCLNGSTCSVPLCTGGPSSADAGGPVGSSDGGTAISGTCADLAACCAAMTDTSFRDSCNQTLSDARARGGDAVCAVVYSTYRSAGACK